MDNWKIVNSSFSAKEMAKAKFNSNLGMSDIHVIPKLDLTGEIQYTQRNKINPWYFNNVPALLYFS